MPAQIYDWKAAPETRGKAQQVQERNREQFLRAFSHGLAVLGYDRDAGGQRQVLARALGREVVVRVGIEVDSPQSFRGMSKVKASLSSSLA